MCPTYSYVQDRDIEPPRGMRHILIIHFVGASRHEASAIGIVRLSMAKCCRALEHRSYFTLSEKRKHEIYMDSHVDGPAIDPVKHVRKDIAACYRLLHFNN